ncbi:MAG: hypothetical protein M3R54_10750 [Chloroflexota bacterium]|nr:hypothetical protein [Chloroflexota bacterium]
MRPGTSIDGTTAVSGVIVDLDRRAQQERSGTQELFALGGLFFSCVAFACLVLLMRPSAILVSAPSGIGAALSAELPVPRGIVLQPLQLPARFGDIDLAAMPDRLANEAAPPSLRAIIIVRGVAGVASADGPAVIVWTERGIAYRLASPIRTTAELIAIAEQLQ